jgi:peptidoglycan/xylan/chitin deacetylase (PgdA/CDA1 family)
MKQIAFIGFLVLNSTFFSQVLETETRAKIAITIDDVPNTKLYAFSNQQAELLTVLDALNIPIAIFVNEGLINRTADTNQNLILLEAWASRPYVTLGNHTFSHSRYSEVGYDEFKMDIQKGEILLHQFAAKYNKPLNYFRFPFNDLGLDSIQHLRIDSLLYKMNYKIAPFTIESADWMFNAVYEYYILNSKFDEAQQIGELYVSKTIEFIQYFDSLSLELYGKRINQIYLCHDNALNSKYLSALIEQLDAKYFEMVSLDEAMKEDAYLQVDHYFKKWGISWFYRWESDSKKRLDLMKKEPDLNQIETVYNALIK